MAGYLGASPVPQTIQKKQSFTATASQTTFTTTGYTDGAFINVYLNGVRLINGTDYTATNGSDIVLTTGASASDVLDFETFNEFTLVDQTLETPTFRTSATLKNDTEEDTDGGRESTLIFKGEQSGGEISTLAEIEASHDGTSDDEKGDLIFRTNDGSDGSSPTEAARIDSSQNLLVGTTNIAAGVGSSSNVEGVSISSGSYGGFVTSSRDGNPSANFNRMTSDGDITQFRKDGLLVGSIGVLSSRMFTGTGDVGLFFNDQTDAIHPWNTSTNASRDSAIDLGVGTRRFKDLYLSGGAYLGGTGAANYLHDYEYGTFTPTYGGGTTNPSGVTYDSTVGNEGVYVKVGRLVYVQINIRTDAISNVGSGDLLILGLPFATASLSGQGGIGSLTVSQSKDFAGEAPSMAYITEGSTSITLFYRTAADGNAITSACSDLATGSNDNLIRLGGTYYTTS